MRKYLSLFGLLIAVALFAAACGSDDDSSSEGSSDEAASTEDGSSEGGPTHDQMSAEELEVWQTDLNAVGCYAGAIDGSLGPQTEAAVQAFQTAQGLTIDGTLGPETEAALEEAVAAGVIVCTSTTGDGVTGGDTVSLSSASYSKEFTTGTCSVNADVSNISLRAQADNLSLAVDATEGAGTLAVSGGTESDGITLNGTVEAVTIGSDRSYTVTGTFEEPNNAGETFSLTGACPE